MKTMFLMIMLLFYTIEAIHISEILINMRLSTRITCLLIYDSSINDGPFLIETIERIRLKREGYFKLYIADCKQKSVESELGECSQKGRSKLPTLLFSIPPLNMKDKLTGKVQQSKIIPFQGVVNEKSIYKFIAPLLRAYSRELKTKKDERHFQLDFPDIPRVIYYTNKQKLSPLFQGLTANFRNTIAFGHVFSGSQLANSKQNIEYPLLLLNETMKIDIKGELMDMISEMKKYTGIVRQIFVEESATSIYEEEVTKQNIGEKIYNREEYALLHVLGNDFEEHPQWKNLRVKFKKMFHYYQSEDPSVDYGISSTPAIIYFPRALIEKTTHRKIFTPSQSFGEIEKQIDRLIRDSTVLIMTKGDLHKATMDSVEKDKFMVILFYKKIIPIFYKAIANIFYNSDYINFYKIQNPAKDMYIKFNITKLPFLVMVLLNKNPTLGSLVKEQKITESQVTVQQLPYSGQWNFNGVYGQIDTFIASKKSVHSLNRKRKRIRIIDRESRLNTFCAKENCFLLFTNGSPQSLLNDQKYLDSLQQLTKENFGFIDGVCHSQLSNAFNFTRNDFPKLTYINAKLKIHGPFTGQFVKQQLNIYYKKIKSNAITTKSYQKLTFSNKNCQEDYDKLNTETEQTQLKQKWNNKYGTNEEL